MWDENYGENKSLLSKNAVGQNLLPFPSPDSSPSPDSTLCVCVCVHLVVSKSATPWTVAQQAPLCMGFPRQEYWSGLPFPTPGDLSDPRIEPTSLGSPALASRFFTTVPPGTPSITLGNI